MKTTTIQANKLMDILAELYCNAYVSINGEPNMFELPKLTDEVNEFARETFCEVMKKYECLFHEKWEIEEI